MQSFEEEIEDDAGISLLDAVASMVEYVRAMEARNAFLETENATLIEKLVAERQVATVDAEALHRAIETLRQEVQRTTLGIHDHR